MNVQCLRFLRSKLRCIIAHQLSYKKTGYPSSSLKEIFDRNPADISAFRDVFIDAKGLFEYPSLLDSTSLIGMKYNAISKKDKYYVECLDRNRTRKLVQVFDDLSDALCCIADLAEFLRMMHPDTDMIIEARDICIELSQIVEKLNTDKELYNCIKEVAEKGDKFPLTDVEKHIVDLFVFDFELCGIHLPETDRQKVVHYNNYILQLGQTFMTVATQPRVLSKTSIPSTFEKHFNITNEGDLLVNGFSDLDDEYAREFAYKTYLAPNKDQEELLDNVLLYRRKLAEKCGFPTYAHRALKSSTAGTPEFVFEFLNTLNHKLRDDVTIEFDLMRNIKSSVSKQDLSMWDIPYFIAKIKRDWLKIHPREFSPYFSLGTCMDGLNQLYQSLFGISLVHEKLAPGESWITDLYKIKVVHHKEGELGIIYCDLFERVGKSNQDCHFTIKGGRRLPDGSYQNPIVVVVLNLPVRSKVQPPLLTPFMVENLFHEMGHALHSMLGRAEYQHVTGTRCATDFAEVPSILMEYFAADPRVLKTFAKHHETGETIPDFLLERLCDSKTICTAAELQSQIFYSVLDYTYHTDRSAPGNTTKILAETQAQYYPVPYVENTAWQLKFSHLIGYGAKYYSYLMSRAIASSIWQQCFNGDPFDRKMGEKYRRECLEHGGGKPPRNLVNDFLNRNITPASLTESLVNEIKMCNEKLS